MTSLRRHLRVEKTSGSRPGRPEYEVFAPDGMNFSGPHSLVVRGVRQDAVDEGEASRYLLTPCEHDCECGFHDGEDDER